MKSARHLLVSSEKETDDQIKHGSLELYIDTSYRKEHHARQYGYVVADYKDLKAGDKIYFHYLTLLNDPVIPPNTWVVHYKMVYCVIRDEIVMLNNYVLVEMMDEEITSALIVEKKKSTTLGIVRHSHRDDLKNGDMVLFRPIAAFVNKIEDKEYYVMESSDILAKVI